MLVTLEGMGCRVAVEALLDGRDMTIVELPTESTSFVAQEVLSHKNFSASLTAAARHLLRQTRHFCAGTLYVYGRRSGWAPLLHLHTKSSVS